jgi:hypothetical protein
VFYFLVLVAGFRVPVGFFGVVVEGVVGVDPLLLNASILSNSLLYKPI